MRESRFKSYWIVMVLAIWFSGTAYSHVNYPCLQETSRVAQALKECTHKSHSDACREERQSLSDQVGRCQRQAFTSDAIEEAIREGESNVSGGEAYFLPDNVGDSPQAIIDTGKGNIANFRQQFANVSAFPVEELDQGANQGGCHQAFLARASRFQFLGDSDLKRYRADDDAKPKPYRLYFFARMTEGVCYAAPKAGQDMENGDLAVVNIPSGFFTFLEQAARHAGFDAVIIECADESECMDKKREMVALQVDYQATYLRLRRMQQCQSLAQENNWFRRMAKMRLQKEPLPTHCMESDLEANIRQLKKNLQTTAGKLFEKL